MGDSVRDGSAVTGDDQGPVVPQRHGMSIGEVAVGLGGLGAFRPTTLAQVWWGRIA